MNEGRRSFVIVLPFHPCYNSFNPPPTYRTNRERGPMSEGVRVVLLLYHVYRALLDRVEDLEDLLVMREAEAEYLAGEGRPFDEIVAELEVEDRADVSG